MMKLVIRFLLVCCFLFLGGYAHTSQDGAHQFRKNTVQQSASYRDAAVRVDQDFITSAASSNNGNVNDPLKATEEDDEDDDDEMKSSKRHSGGGKSDITSFYTSAPDYFLHCLSGRLPFCEHLSYTSASKFIIHCVFRI